MKPIALPLSLPLPRVQSVRRRSRHLQLAPVLRAALGRRGEEGLRYRRRTRADEATATKIAAQNPSDNTESAISGISGGVASRPDRQNRDGGSSRVRESAKSAPSDPELLSTGSSLPSLTWLTCPIAGANDYAIALTLLSVNSSSNPRQKTSFRATFLSGCAGTAGEMPRASWNGFLRLSLVTCPVYLSPAAKRRPDSNSSRCSGLRQGRKFGTT